MFDPRASKPEPLLVNCFNGFQEARVAGITETSPDVFQVAVANVSLKTLTAEPDSNRIYSFTFPRDHHCKEGSLKYTLEPEIALTAALPNASFINGLTTLNPDTILAADIRKSLVYAINTKTGAYTTAISDPSLVGHNPPGIGVNGIKVRGEYLYFTSIADNFLGKVPIDLQTGAAMSDVTVVATLPDKKLLFDDFSIDGCGNIYAAVISEMGRGDLWLRWGILYF